ncbi:hypothetical protein MASR2M47_46190 [Draconibacterium sp.]
MLKLISIIMDITIKIDDTLAQSKKLSKDYSFLTISEDFDDVHENILAGIRCTTRVHEIPSR